MSSTLKLACSLNLFQTRTEGLGSGEFSGSRKFFLIREFGRSKHEGSFSLCEQGCDGDLSTPARNLIFFDNMDL